MLSIVGPSRTRRPRNAKGSIRKGCTRSSGPETAPEGQPSGIASPPFSETPGEDALLGVQPVLRLVPHDRLGTIDDASSHLFAGFARKARIKIAVRLACAIRRSSTRYGAS